LTLCRYGYTQDQLQVKASSYRVKNGKSSFVMENCQSGETGVVDLTTPGKHMMLNTLAAFAMGFHYGISLKNMIKIVGEFKTVAGRMKILPCNSYLLIDDSYNANPDSVCAALQTMHSLDNNGKKVAILGDMLELGELSSALHEEIGRQLVKNKIDFFIAVGEAMQFALRSAKKAGMKEQQLKSAANSEDAVLQLKPFMEFNKGDLVLVKGSRGMKMERIVQTLLCSTTS
jgi:UDP-N-acetylmuramoyl-tripeptide--D-alanyl-D-alanine ligase